LHGKVFRIDYFLNYRILFLTPADPGLKYLNSLMRSGMGKIRTHDPEWKRFGSRIRDKHPGSSTLEKRRVCEMHDYSREEGSSVYQAAKTGIVPSLRTILAKFSAQDQ
jgi:hypothetical protein